MAQFLDTVPFSGIIRIRDMMYSVDRPFRLDQGDVSFDAPESVKAALRKGIDDNRTHYVQTTGIPPLLDLLVETPEIARHLDRAELAKLCDPANYLGQSGVMVDRVLNRRRDKV